MRAGLRGFGGAGTWTPLKLGPSLIQWHEAGSALNTVPSGAIDVWADLSGNGRAMSAPSSTQRPAQSASVLLTNTKTALCDGVDDYLRIASTTRPSTIAIVYRMPSYSANQAIVSFGTAYPYLAKGNVTDCVKYFSTAGGAIQCSSAPLTDGYFHLIVVTDDGTNTRLTVYDPSFTVATQTQTGTDATARAASPGALAFGALGNGTFPQTADAPFLLTMSSVITTAQEAALLDYCRRSFVDLQPAPKMPFIGTLSTNRTAQPRTFPIVHDGVSGDTISLWSTRVVGAWGGGGTVTIGGADDPGVGNRGAIEALINAGNLNIVAAPIIGTADSTGAISWSAMALTIRRAFAIASAMGATLAWQSQSILPVAAPASATYLQANIDAYNTAGPGQVTTLQGFGLNVWWTDITTGFTPGTDLLADGLHLTDVGAPRVAALIAAELVSHGVCDSSHQLWLSGHSHVSGGTPKCTAQSRNWIARAIGP